MYFNLAQKMWKKNVVLTQFKKYIHTYIHTHTHTHTHIYIYIYIYIYSSYNVRCPAFISRQPGVITQFRWLKVVLSLLALPSSFCHRTGYLKELYIYIYIYIYIFIIQRVKACDMPCLHQLPTSFGGSRRYCHSWRYQAAFATGQGI